jgi:formate dehydrogenase assembly factor FdhD
MQKALVAGIGMVIGIGAPTSLSLDLARKFDITLIGFVKIINIIFITVSGELSLIHKSRRGNV